MSDQHDQAAADLQAEQAVLGAFLLTPGETTEPASSLAERDLFSVGHRLILTAIRRLADRGDAVEPGTIADELREAGELDKVAGNVGFNGASVPASGEDYLFALADSSVAALPSSVSTRVRAIERRAARRRLIVQLDGALRGAQDGQPVAELLPGLGEAFESAVRQAGNGAGLEVLTAPELLQAELPEREILLAPWLRAQDLGMIYGWRGLGKSWVSLGIAVAVAGGGRFLRWTAPEPRDVLLIDGEMAASEQRERLAAIIAGMNVDPGDRLRIATPDLQPGAMPNLATPEGQAQIEPFIDGARLVVVDNLSSLCRGVVENDAESWESVLLWLLSLRRRGIAVLLVHHAGKGGQQRGTSRREDQLNVTIALRKPEDCRADEGARFEVHFEKNRGLRGGGVAPFEAALATASDGRLTWSTRDLEAATHERILDLHREGLSVTEIAKEVGRHKSNVSRAIRKAGETGGSND